MCHRTSFSKTSKQRPIVVKLLSIVGARPQFVKAAMIAGAVTRHNRQTSSKKSRVRHILVHTGQHYEHRMSGVFFDELDLRKPDHNLAVGSGTQGAQTGAMLDKIERVILADRPDVVMVYGDTNSTVAGALAAAKLHVQIAHLESGLRSFNRRMPEEINRVASDHISDVLFCPTDTAVENLRREGITKNVFQTGDVMLDAVLTYRGKAEKQSKLLEGLEVEPKGYALATIHRAENTDCSETLGSLLNALVHLGHPVVLPMHPRVRDRLRKDRKLRAIAKMLGKCKDVRILEPVSYLDMLTLEISARLILTDSGGVQKEAFFAAVPCLTLREETEWLETQADGWNTVVGTDPDRIRTAADKIWSNVASRNGKRPDWTSFGDGQSAEKTLAALLTVVNQGAE
jgi:UDP-GlcNAc3NAcA epimerase